MMDMKLVWKALEKIKDAKIRAFIINALQEQAEREKGCEYCNGKALKNLVLIHQFRDREPNVALHGGNTPIKDDEKPVFCPKCGKRLK